MSSTMTNDLPFGALLAVATVVSICITLVELRRKGDARDGEAIRISGGFAAFCGIFAVLLLTGWMNVLPLPH